MKRLIAAAVLLTATVIICITGFTAVTKTCEIMLYLDEQCLTAVQNNDWNKACKLVAEMTEYWADSRVKLSLFVNHGDIESVTEKIGLLSVQAEEEDLSSFKETLCEISNMLNTVKREQQLSPDSFL